MLPLEHVEGKEAYFSSDGMLKSMGDYIRTWWLINRISKETLKRQAQSRRASKALGNIGRVGYTLHLEDFLESRTDKYFFGLGKKLSSEWKDLRTEKDRKLLQRSNTLVPPFTQSVETPSGVVITTTPEGDFFSKPTNGLVDFCEKYKIMYVIITAIIALIAHFT